MNSNNNGNDFDSNSSNNNCKTLYPPDLVSRWLMAANLDYAIPNFQMAGIVSPRSFAELELSYFEPLGVTKADDRKRLFYLIQKIKGEIEKEKTSKSLKQERRDDNGNKGHTGGKTFHSPIVSKVNAGNTNVDNHDELYCHDEGDDYDDVIVSTVNSDAISPVTLASQIASLSEDVHQGKQNHGEGRRTTTVTQDQRTGTAFKDSSLLNDERDVVDRDNFENNVCRPTTSTTSTSKKKLTAREQLERELELRASKRREQKLMDLQQQKVRQILHHDQYDDSMNLEERSTTQSTTSTAGGEGGGGGSKKRRQSFLPSVRSYAGRVEGSNSSVVDVRSRRNSLGIHRRETVRKTNTTLSAAAAAAEGRERVEERGVKQNFVETDLSETSDLSASVSSYRSLELAAQQRKNSNASVNSMGITTATLSEISSRSVHRRVGIDCTDGVGDDSGISSVGRMDENRHGNFVMKDTLNTSLAKGGGNSGIKSSVASHSSRTRRLSTIPSSTIAPLSPLVEFSSAQLDESMANVGPRNPVRRKSSIGASKVPSSANHGTADSRSQKKLGGGAKSPGSTNSSGYPSRPSSRTSSDGSQRVKINKLNVPHLSYLKNNTSVLSSSSSVASSVRRRRQHLLSPTNVRGKDQPSHSSVRSHQQRSVLSTKSRTSPTSYTTSSSPKRYVSPKKSLSPPKSGLIVSNSRRPHSPIRNSPAMSRAASPMSNRRVKSPIGGSSTVHNVNDNAMGFHLTTTEVSWAAQIGRLRESFESEHAQYLAMIDHRTSNNEDNENEMRIRVIVRKRPMSKHELSEGAEVDVIQPLVYNNYGRILVHQPKTRLDLTKEVETTSFAFDNAFDENSNNIDIYEQAVQSLIPGLFRGKWASVFAYGQTGSGKTFTMMGSNATGMKAGNQVESSISGANLGLYYLAAKDVFHIAEDPAHKGVSIGVSLFEIYGGKLLDLLNARSPVRCLEDSRGKVCFPGLSEHPVSNAEELMEIIDAGALNRSTGTTSANADSSRSHAVLQLSLRKDSKRGKNVEHGRLTFIDLAGSERGADTSKACRTTRLEGAEINTSLLALKEVIRALATGSSLNRIPFRGSKLTQVLKESFVGKNSRTVMVSCIAPNMKNCDHTLNTLRYADRVKERHPQTGMLSSSVATGHKIKRDKAETILFSPRPLTAPAASFRIVREEESSDGEIPPPPPSHEEIPAYTFGENNDSDDEAGKTLNSEFDSLDEALKSNDNLSVSNNGPTISKKSKTSNAAQSLIATHKTVMSKLLVMLQHEMTLVNDTDANRDNIDEYMKELEHLSDQQLVLLNTLGESLESYNGSRGAQTNETDCYDDSFDIDLRE